MTTFSLKDYYDNLLASQGNEKKEDEEFSGGIPIPFLGWAQIDREDTEDMLRKQLEIVNTELLKARETIMEQANMLDLFTRFVKDEDLMKQWMFYVQDRKNA